MDEEEGEVKMETLIRVLEVFGGWKMVIFVLSYSFMTNYVDHYVKLLKG